MEVAELNNILLTISEVELIYRSKVRPSLRPTIRSAKDCFDILMHQWDKDKIEYVEQFKVLYLNRSNRVLALNITSTGGLTGTVADPRFIFATALKLNATSVILSHNHPGGNLKPSEQDKLITEKIRQAGRLLDINVLDHIILSTEGFYSFAEEGLL